MSFLDKAKKLAEQAAQKAGPLIDKAAPHAQTAVDKAGQQIDKRTGGKYHGKIEAVEAKVGELADKRLGRTGAGQPDAGPDDAFPARPGAVAGTGSFPAQPDAVTDETFPTDPGLDASSTEAPFPPSADPAASAAPAQPDVAGQPDDLAYPVPADAGFPAATAEPAFTAESAEVTFPAQPPESTFPAAPDSTAGRPDDAASSAAPGAEYPGLSEGPTGAAEVVDPEDRPGAPAS